MNKAADIEAQAAIWVARGDRARGACDAELRAWLAADPRHRAAYLRLAEAWRRSERLERLRPADGSVDPDLLRPSRATTATPHRPLWRLADRRLAWRTAIRPRIVRLPIFRGIAATALVFVIAFALWWTFASPRIRTYRTGAGGLQHVILADGSSIILNAQTELSVQLTSRARNVFLKQGEAQFSVAHNIHRPFEVHAADRVVLAVGTAFDVWRDAGQLEVTVTEGRVALLAMAQRNPRLASLPPPSLSAGETAWVGPNTVRVSRSSPSELSRRLSWEHRELVFHGESLGDAVTEFNRYNDRKIELEDPSIASLQIGGNFQALDAASFVAALERSFGISAKTSSDGTIYLSRTASR